MIILFVPAAPKATIIRDLLYLFYMSLLMLWKKSGEEWTDEELMPVQGLKITMDGSVEIMMKDDTSIEVSYEIESRSMIWKRDGMEFPVCQ